MIEVLLDSLWQGAFVVAIAAAVTAFVPQRHAATRYAVWFATLVALAALPLISHFLFGAPPAAIPSAVTRTTAVASHATQRAADAGGSWFWAVWLAGVLVCLSRLLLSHFRITRIVRSALPAPAIGEGVFTSPAIGVPIAAGLFHPVVIVPDDFAKTLDAVVLADIVAHERAHILRKDVLGNLTQRLFEALLFFNPWVYVIGHQLRKEREAACDDWAVHAAGDPDRYASFLASLALHNPGSGTPLLTPSAMGSGRILVGRIARLLNGKAAEMKANRLVVVTAVALFVLLGFAFQTPRGLASANCFSDPVVVNAVMPNVPESVVKAHPNAYVIVAVTVTAGGHASNVKPFKSSGDWRIDTAVADAAAHSTYKPEIRNCKPVSGGQYLFRADFAP
jgi:beta-lactamase regulating signal transducer with metallopeptidase domain